MSNVRPNEDMYLDRYKDSVNALLLDFQWIEMSLRIVIGASYDLLGKSAPHPIVFRPKAGALTKDALGRLIERYGEVSPNVEMQRNLRDLLKHRNHCAHQSFILSGDEQEDPEFLEGEILRMQALKERTRAIVMKLHAEMAEVGQALNQSVASIAARQAAETFEEGQDERDDAYPSFKQIPDAAA